MIVYDDFLIVFRIFPCILPGELQTQPSVLADRKDQGET